MTRGYSPKLPLSFSLEGGYTLNKNIPEVAKQNLKNILLTNPGERIWDSNFGVGLKRFLFEQRVEQTFERIKDRIYSQVEEYLPYIEIQKIDIKSDEENENTIYLTISYYITSISIGDLIKITVRP